MAMEYLVGIPYSRCLDVPNSRLSHIEYPSKTSPKVTADKQQQEPRPTGGFMNSSARIFHEQKEVRDNGYLCTCKRKNQQGTDEDATYHPKIKGKMFVKLIAS